VTAAAAAEVLIMTLNFIIDAQSVMTVMTGRHA